MQHRTESTRAGFAVRSESLIRIFFVFFKPKIAGVDLKFLFLEPFFGGSHRDFATGLIAHSRHQIDLLTLPARFWKWRMRGAALYFVKKLGPAEFYDGLFVTDLMSISDLKALLGPSCPPCLAYFHENQLSYPLAPGEAMDFQFGFTDITSALAADRVVFNSKSHFEMFFSYLPRFLKMMPEYRPNWIIGKIKKKASVIHPGCQFSLREPEMSFSRSGPPLVIWNHRWEFDKNPIAFFNAMDMVVKRGLDFRLALLGENFQTVPKEFVRARKRLGDKIVQYGYVDSKKAYIEWLMRGSVVVSTARQENFGISLIEATRWGCFPLAPNRLAYPEIIPKAFHSDCLYRDQEDLVQKLCFLVSKPNAFESKRHSLSTAMGRFSWEKRVAGFDEALKKTALTGK
jgi:glycosyltransferase involved in cell wall biosynthesis